MFAIGSRKAADADHRLQPQERTVLRIIEQADDSPGVMTVDRIVGFGVIDERRVRDLVAAGCCEFCSHPTERTWSGRPARAVRITQDGRVALTRMNSLH